MKKLSVIIANRHSTSISLEPEFIEELRIIASKSNLTINELVTQIDSERQRENLSSAIRVYILKQLKKQTTCA
ncbi:MAG: ribbon-helix-helix domain-containing protein [Alphaproteobacteria bacterium]|nr:ribbon-helix-helix domain-containing protein [Alphaproteobacteria bacterium]MBQ8630883.1 ribbon-helix-helix domain-containing protein [Alphaproteobacteria bacterium]